MLEEIKAITYLITAVAIPAVLFVFRVEVRKLVGWIVSFTHVHKTKDGFALTPGSSTEPQSPTIVSKESIAIAAIRSDGVAEEADANAESDADADTWWMAVHDKRFDDATLLLEKEIAKESDKEQQVGLRSIMGNVIFEKSPEKGIEYFEKLLIEFPTDSTPFAWYSRTLAWKDLVSKSLAVIERGLAVVADPGRLLETLSDVLLRAGKESDAFDASFKGVQRSPNYVANYLNLAQIESGRKNFEEAKAWYRRALEVSNGSATVLAAYAEWLSDNHFDDEALLRYQSLASEYPTNSSYRAFLGNAYLANGFEDLALEAYLEADKIAEGREEWILSNIGNVYKNQKLYSRAEEYLRRALAVEPSSQYALERLAGTLKEREEQKKKIAKLLKEVRGTALAPVAPLLPHNSVSVVPPKQIAATTDPNKA